MCEVRPSPTHGQGLFATKDFKRGDLIFREEPLTIVPFRKLGPKGIYHAYGRLIGQERRDWDSLSYSATAEERRRFAEEAGVEDEFKTYCGLAVARWDNNSFEDGVDGDEMLCIQAARINHRCIPNALWYLHPTSGKFEVRAVTDIAKHEEIFVSYVPQQWRKEDRRSVLAKWLFTCTCPRCADGDGSAEARRRTCHDICQSLLLLGGKPDLNEQLELYNRLLEQFMQEESMVWENAHRYFIISKLYQGLNDDDKRREADRKALELAKVCYGSDIVLPEKWKDKLVDISILPGPPE